MDPNEISCPYCTFTYGRLQKNCPMCGSKTPQVNNTVAPAGNSGPACPACTFPLDGSTKSCSMCGFRREEKREGKSCLACTFPFDEKDRECPMCGTERAAVAESQRNNN